MTEFLDVLGASIFNVIVLWWAFEYGFPRLAKMKEIPKGQRPPGAQ